MGDDHLSRSQASLELHEEVPGGCIARDPVCVFPYRTPREVILLLPAQGSRLAPKRPRDVEEEATLHLLVPLVARRAFRGGRRAVHLCRAPPIARSEEHTSELQSHHDLVCRL